MLIPRSVLLSAACLAACSRTAKNEFAPIPSPKEVEEPTCPLMGPADTIWAEEDLDVPLQAIAMEAPRYPVELQIERQEGRVLWAFVIQPNGRIDPCTLLLKFATQEAFVEPSRKSIVSLRFAPTQRHGVPVFVQVTKSITFKLGY